MATSHLCLEAMPDWAPSANWHLGSDQGLLYQRLYPVHYSPHMWSCLLQAPTTHSHGLSVSISAGGGGGGGAEGAGHCVAREKVSWFHLGLPPHWQWLNEVARYSHLRASAALVLDLFA